MLAVPSSLCKQPKSVFGVSLILYIFQPLVSCLVVAKIMSRFERSFSINRPRSQSEEKKPPCTKKSKNKLKHKKATSNKHCKKTNGLYNTVPPKFFCNLPKGLLVTSQNNFCVLLPQGPENYQNQSYVWFGFWCTIRTRLV
jgi:hypothetical protein